MENKDLDLKVLCKILYDNMGFATHYEVKIRNRSYINQYKVHDISDIDVYGYKFNGDLSFTSVGAECKSGETNALEEFFKFLGIVDHYNINVGYLIKTKIHQNAREMAAKNNFRCFTEAEIRKVLHGFGIDIDRQQKVELAKYSRFLKQMEALKKRNEKLYDYISLDYWNRENWRNIHNLLHLLHNKQGLVLIEDPVFALSNKYTHYYILELFSRSVLKNISDAMLLNYSDIESSILSSLFGGAESLHERRRIFDMVSQVTGKATELEAEWTQDYLLLCSKYSQSTLAASQIPRLIQDLYGNCFYDDRIKINVGILKKYPDVTRKFTQDLMQFLTKTCEIDQSVFSDFMEV